VPGDLVALNCAQRHVIRVNQANLEKINEWIRQNKACIVIPVPGYNTMLGNGTPSTIIRDVLREENVSLELFRCKHMPEAASKGTFRPVLLKPENLKYIIKEEGSVYFTFVLRKGMYATVLLREYLKPSNPETQGF